MSLIKMLDQAIDERFAGVEYNGSVYVLKSSLTGDSLSSTLLLTESDQQKKARHWGSLHGVEFDPKLVRHVMIVTMMLQKHPDDAPNEPTLAATVTIGEGKQSVEHQAQYVAGTYDETVIAKLAVSTWPLFLQLVGAAYLVAGFSDESTGFDAVAAGNSSEPVDSSSTSTAG